MRTFISAAVSAAVMLAFTAGANLARAQGGDAEAGKVLYDKSCAMCHGSDGAPQQAIAKMMKVEISHLGSKKVQAKNDAALAKVITDGSGKMKPMKGLADRDMADLIAYVRTLKKT